MKTLPIADCRLPIKKSFAGRGFARGGHDGCQCVGFVVQRGQFLCGHRAGFNEQFEPQRGFVSLFLDGADFGDEFSRTAGAATGAVICRHGSSAADNLSGDRPAGIVRFGNGARQLDDSQRKRFRAGFEFGRVHGANLQTQSAIGNRQSAISK